MCSAVRRGNSSVACASRGDHKVTPKSVRHDGFASLALSRSTSASKGAGVIGATTPMGAYAREDRVELIVDINEFYDRVKIVFPHTELEPLGLEPDTYSGMFLEESVQQLVEFCARNPKYHIVTGLDEGRSINRYVLGPHIYSLAIGDKNPCLMLSMFADPNRGLVDEDMICAALAILSDPDDRGE